MVSKYLVVTHLYFEEDNNTPSDQLWVEVAEFEQKDLAHAEKVIIDDFNSDTGAVDIEVEFIPLSDIDHEWRKISEIW